MATHSQKASIQSGRAFIHISSAAQSLSNRDTLRRKEVLKPRSTHRQPLTSYKTPSTSLQGGSAPLVYPDAAQSASHHISCQGHYLDLLSIVSYEVGTNLDFSCSTFRRQVFVFESCPIPLELSTIRQLIGSCRTVSFTLCIGSSGLEFRKNRPRIPSS